MENGMNKEKIVVPKEIRYISDWEGYSLENYNFPHILNKVLTGCGFTEYCIRKTNKQKLILISPRKFLLENKWDQHKEDPEEIYYVRNEIETSIDYELDMTDDKQMIARKKETSKMSDKEVQENLMNLKQGIKDYQLRCTFKHTTPKILVTYDSFRHVKEALMETGTFEQYQVIVDEFQSIFIDSRFKSDTEIELLGFLKGVNKVCYVSATPMLDKYLDMLDEFKDLKYFELDWETEDPGRIKRPKLDVKFTVRSLNEEAGRAVQSYLKGNFESRLDPKTGGLIESRECVIFMNSVTNICQVIRSNKLHLEDCNVLCARTTRNETLVRRAFNEVLRKEHEDEKKPPRISTKTEVIGSIPKKGKSHKMFTFCTRTVYLGADFYSTNARSFIFSDSNIDCLAVDISMDLEQILGRQRLDENPWKDSASLIIRTTKEKLKYTKEEFDEKLEEKKLKTESLLRVYTKTDLIDKHNLAEKFEKDAKNSKYKDDYVAVNKHLGKDLLPVFNNLVMVAEMRAFDTQQIDYKDRFTVFSAIKGEGIDGISDYISEVAERINSMTTSIDKLKAIVEFGEAEDREESDMSNLFELLPSKYGEYYNLLGPEIIKARSYQESKLKNEWLKLKSNESVTDDLINEIYKTFLVGKRYTKTDIKQTLKELYQRLGYSKTAKASDLEIYFYIKKVYITDIKKNGFEIIGKK